MYKSFLNRAFLLVFSVFFLACSSDDGSVSNDQLPDNDSTDIFIDDPMGAVTISGKAQKGPFITGSDVTISELNNDLSPTGRIFNTTISNDEGSYSMPEIELISPFIEVRVEGFFYDEITGRVSDNELTISSIADISDDANVNVNILTHLEDKRIKTLVNDGLTFEESKHQSYEELALIFGNNSDADLFSDDLDLDDDAFLFAVSSIISGVEYEKDESNKYAAWLRFLVEFEEDFGDDGVINSDDVIDDIFIGAFAATGANDIRSGLDRTFEELGVQFDIPSFEPYIDAFMANSSLNEHDNTMNDLFPRASSGNSNVIRLTGELSETTNNLVLINFQDELDSLEFDMYYMTVGNDNSFSAESDSWDDYDESFEGDTLYGHYDRFFKSGIDEAFNVPITFSGQGSVTIRYWIYKDGSNDPILIYNTLTW